MKVQVHYVISESVFLHKLGRDAWITKDDQGRLCIGSIYKGEADAADITEQELAYVLDTRKLAVTRVIPSKMEE